MKRVTLVIVVILCIAQLGCGFLARSIAFPKYYIKLEDNKILEIETDPFTYVIVETNGNRSTTCQNGKEISDLLESPPEGSNFTVIKVEMSDVCNAENIEDLASLASSE